jgi:hypothetical protein
MGCGYSRIEWNWDYEKTRPEQEWKWPGPNWPFQYYYSLIVGLFIVVFMILIGFDQRNNNRVNSNRQDNVEQTNPEPPLPKKVNKRKNKQPKE